MVKSLTKMLIGASRSNAGFNVYAMRGSINLPDLTESDLSMVFESSTCVVSTGGVWV